MISTWVASVLGAGGLVTAMVALRKSGPEARSVEATTRRTEVDTLRSLIETLESRLDRERQDCKRDIDRLQARVQRLETKLREAGIDPHHHTPPEGLSPFMD